MLKDGDKIGIVCCSNGQKRSYSERIKVFILCIFLPATFQELTG